MNSPSMRASPVIDNVFIIIQNLFPASGDKIAVSFGVASLFFLSKAAYGNHVLRHGFQAPLGNFMLVTVGLLHPVSSNGRNLSYLCHYLRYVTLMTTIVSDICDEKRLSVPDLVLFFSGGTNNSSYLCDWSSNKLAND
jgi:hypothetical protein